MLGDQMKAHEDEGGGDGDNPGILHPHGAGERPAFGSEGERLEWGEVETGAGGWGLQGRKLSADPGLQVGGAVDEELQPLAALQQGLHVPLQHRLRRLHLRPHPAPVPHLPAPSHLALLCRSPTFGCARWAPGGCRRRRRGRSGLRRRAGRWGPGPCSQPPQLNSRRLLAGEEGLEGGWDEVVVEGDAEVGLEGEGRGQPSPLPPRPPQPPRHQAQQRPRSLLPHLLQSQSHVSCHGGG